MQEFWLQPNRRAILFGCVPLVGVILLGGWLTLAIPSLSPHWRALGGVTVVGGISALVGMLAQLRRPRIGYCDGQVRFYLIGRDPIEIPVGVVEAFFVGQGPATLPAGVAKQQQTHNLVARLSQRETDWANRDVKPALGQWCGGYVTIRGTWCEPLEDDVVRRLNHRLKEVKDGLKV